eukprot:4838832-Pleurochrysis_carterae.AAC.1
MSETAGTLVRVNLPPKPGEALLLLSSDVCSSSECRGRPASSALHSAMASSRSSWAASSSE